MQILFLMFFILSSCGTSGSDGGYDDKPPEQESGKFRNIEAQIEQHCGNCHGNGGGQRPFDSASRWNNSSAKKRIENQSMPPNKKLPPEDKQQLLESFEDEKSSSNNSPNSSY